MDSKENVMPGEKKNRSRGENWTLEEKDMLFEIMRKSAPIIENKLTDTNTNKKKHLEWVKVQNKLRELTGKHRDITQLKGFWRRAKVTTKKTVSQHKRALQTTGGGPRPPTPPADDLKIMELCPIDFVTEENIYDSDAVYQLTGQDNNAEIIDNEVHNNTIYDLDEDIDQLDVSLVDEIMVTHVNSNEIDIKACDGATLQTKTELNTPKKEIKRNYKPKRNFTSKEVILESNMELKKRAAQMMEEEHKIKINFQRQELVHQQLRQKLEIDILMIEKEKKMLELKL